MQQQTFFLVFGPDLTQKFLYVSFFPLDILPCMKNCKEKSANIIYKQITDNVMMMMMVMIMMKKKMMMMQFY